MKKLVVSTCAVLAMVFSISVYGCNPPGEGEGEGEGEGDTGEGEGEGDGGEGEGEGEPPAGTCTSDADCAGGETCQTVFNSPDVPKACFTTCATNDPCTTTTGATGQCVTFQAGGTAFCVVSAGNLGFCGNVANAVCAEPTSPCITLPDNPGTPENESAVGFCGLQCQADGDCAGGLLCSNDIQFQTQTGGPTFGVCAEASTVSATCGTTATGIVVCTGDQTCSNLGGAGTCEQDGAGEGEGEGEGE